MKKVSILTLIAIATIGLVGAMVHFYKIESFVFAWMLNFLLMGCISAFTEVKKATHSSAYFEDKKWEKGGKIYKYFGIDLFRKFFVLIGWEKIRKAESPIRKNTKDLVYAHYKTKRNELNHAVIFLLPLSLDSKNPCPCLS